MRKKIPLIGGIINLIESLKGDIGIVENGDVATHSISAGSYVIWKNELYKASSAIAVDDALSASNLTAVSGGVGNDLNNKFIPGTTPTEFKSYSGSGESTYTVTFEAGMYGIYVLNGTLDIRFAGAYGLGVATSSTLISANNVGFIPAGTFTVKYRGESTGSEAKIAKLF